jgi:DNA-binding transcriptional regulator YhcF (GntR family)
MKINLESTVPIYQQIAESIEDMILSGELLSEERVPSTNELADHYKLNPATARKGLNILVDDDILYKKRGIGMYVKEGAKSLVQSKRKEMFVKNYIVTLLDECKKLNLSTDEVVQLIKENDGRS